MVPPDLQLVSLHRECCNSRYLHSVPSISMGSGNLNSGVEVYPELDQFNPLTELSPLFVSCLFKPFLFFEIII